MTIVPIKTARDYDRALGRIEQLMRRSQVRRLVTSWM